jgi:dihydrofolate synthase/folylpolyglutamate synthase
MGWVVQTTNDDAYAEVLTALYQARRKGIDLSLERMRVCLRRMGLEDGGAPRAVQIAGTNGKGSTARALASILQCAGLRVGAFSSPHLLSLCERFCIDLKAISRDELIRAYRAVSPFAEELTFFEQVTAMAAWLFRNHWVDVAIYEVGLGGRLDSTSAIQTTVGVVTGIARDHCEYLGEELSQIAAEKAAIFRAGGHAVIGLSAAPAIREELLAAALTLGAVPSMVDQAHRAMVPDSLKLSGMHQRDNAAAAVAAVMALRQTGLDIPDDAIALGLSRVELAGRLQEVESGLWIDGAHNPQASQALADAVAAKAPWVLVVGMSEGKEIREFLAPWQGLCEHLIATEGANDRACKAEDIAAQAAAVPMVEVQKTASLAIKRARAIAGNRPILVTGSLLLLGEVLSLLGHGPTDPFLVTDPGARKVAPDTSEAYP